VIRDRLLDIAIGRLEAGWRPFGFGLVQRDLAHSPLGIFLQPEVVRGLQWLRLRRILRYAAVRSPFYREQFHSLGINPRDIRSFADFARLPFTTPHDLSQWQRFLAVPEDDLSVLFTTSGTSGEPKRVFYTARDMRRLANLASLGMRMHVTGRLVALIALPPGLWAGTGEALRVVERAGGLPLPLGALDPRLALRHLQLYRPNVLISSPSFAAALTLEAKKLELKYSLEAIFLGGEMLTPEQKREFQAYWGAQVFDTYGMTEIGGGQAISLPGCGNLHLNGLQLYTEIVDVHSGQPVEQGELVFTTLAREGMPLLRYRSGDLARWAHCADWPLGAIQVLGRADDLLVVGDMGLYASVLAEAVSHAPGATGRMCAILQKDGLLDRLKLIVEGNGVSTETVRALLFDRYPEMKINLDGRMYTLDIQITAELPGQFKPVKIIDERNSR